MALSIWFWVIYVLTLIFGFWSNYTPGSPYPVKNLGGSSLFFVLIFLLGWAVFGSAIK